MRNFTRTATILMTLLLATGLAGAANPPDGVNYQGVLRDAAGNPDNGTHDMVFRFYDLPSGGTEIMSDAHTSSGTGGVTATDGLFNVALGTGSTSDGSGPGFYDALGQVFGDHEFVYMQIEIDGEVLSPRVRVLATPYAHNATAIGGIGSTQLLRSDQSGTLSGNLTTTGSIRSNVNLHLNYNGPDGSSRVYFYENSSNFGEYFGWNNFIDQFEISDTLDINGDLNLNLGGTGRAANGFSLTADDDEQAIFATNVTGSAAFRSYLQLNPGARAILVGYNGIQLGAEDGLGTNRPMMTAEYQDITFYIEGSTAAFLSNAENFSVYGSNLILGRNGPDRDQDLEFYDSGTVEGERLQWDDSEDRFEFSDDFFVFGDSGASGVKNFVQNHPEDPGLEIVYTSLEGNEATTFTRGTARLEGGTATIVLEESFAMVTNPELGLSVHLTPRGQFAELYAESLSTRELVVGSAGGDDIVFDYIVYGLRIGFEDFPVFRKKMAESPIPPSGHHDTHYAERPDLRRHNALERYRTMEQQVHGRQLDQMPRAQALRAAIGESAPGFDVSAGDTVARIHRPDEPVDGATGGPNREPGLEPAPIARRGAVGAAPSSQAPAATTAPVAPATPGDVRARSFRPSASDLASMHGSRQPLQPGDVVVLSASGDGRVGLAQFAAEPTVFGVIASDPGLVLGPEDDTAVAVTTSGVVSCKVDAGYGPIRPGDLLVTSPTPGHAMRTDSAAPGTLLGKAVGALDHGTGTIRIIVTLR